MEAIWKKGRHEYGHGAREGVREKHQGVDVGSKGSKAAADVLDARKPSQGERIGSCVGRVS